MALAALRGTVLSWGGGLAAASAAAAGTGAVTGAAAGAGGAGALGGPEPGAVGGPLMGAGVRLAVEVRLSSLILAPHSSHTAQSWAQTLLLF